LDDQVIADDVTGLGFGSRGIVHGTPLDPVASEVKVNMDLKRFLGEIRFRYKVKIIFRIQ
jgi:hypothetical protein